MTNTNPVARGRIDWERVHQVLATTAAVIAHDLAPLPEEVVRILEQRAHALAAAPPAGATSEALSVVEFSLAAENYAIESVYLREVYPLKDLTPLPGTPAFVCGIMNVRGQIRSVIDLRRFLDLPAPGMSDHALILLVEVGPMELGIMVDSVLGIRTIPATALQRALPTLTGRCAAYFKGVTVDYTTILDAAKLLTDPRLIVDDAA